MRHELTHAVMEEAMSWRVKWLPPWLLEGIAVWVAEQVDDKMAVYLEWMGSEGQDPMLLINGLESQPHNPEDYVEDGLFFKYIEDAFGIATVQRVIYRIIWREPYRHVFEDELHMNWEVLQQQARAHALEAINLLISKQNSGDTD